MSEKLINSCSNSRAHRIGKLWTSRRAVSPLVATVILIAFAVALGAVILNWSVAPIENQVEKISICDEVALKWYVLDGKDDVCYNTTTIKFTVENGPLYDVNDLKLIVIGVNEIFKRDTTRLGLRKGDIKKAEIQYDMAKYGNIREIRVIPLLKTDDETIVCPADVGVKKSNPELC